VGTQQSVIGIVASAHNQSLGPARRNFPSSAWQCLPFTPHSLEHAIKIQSMEEQHHDTADMLTLVGRHRRQVWSRQVRFPPLMWPICLPPICLPPRRAGHRSRTEAWATQL
jgi:hypothetical protein